MTADADKPTATSQPAWRSRPVIGLVVLVAAHLVLAALQSLPVLYLGPNGQTSLAPSLTAWIEPFLTSASEGVLMAQVALIAAYMTLGGGRWVIRLVRGALLVLWFELAQIVGSYFLDGGRDLGAFEEFLAQYSWTAVFLALPFLGYRLVAGRRITSHGNRPNVAAPLQFSILHLLLAMTEAAAVLGVMRALVPWNRHSFSELKGALTEFPINYASYELIALSILAAVPAVLATIRFRSWRKSAVLLLLWEPLLSAGFFVYRYLRPDSDPNFPIANPPAPTIEWLWFWLGVLMFCMSAALTIWLSLLFVRWLGYDFLRFPTRGGGAVSSAARSSA